MPQDFQVVSKPTIAPVSAISWNKDRTQVAVSPNTHEVHIYEFKNGNFNLLHTLSEHTQQVTAIDWAPNTNRIVTCAQDRNAYVFNYEDGVWKPTIVILRINRAATCVKWSPKEDKFALGSGARLLSICFFDPDYDWWGSKHIKKEIHSTITCVDWHPNNVLVAAGGSDFKARVYSGYIKQVDAKPEPTSWGKKMPFGELMAEVGTSDASGGWIHSVAFSPSGEQLAFTSHNSAVSVVDSNNGNAAVRCFHSLLPMRSCLWVTSSSLVCGGHDNVPVLFTLQGNSLEMKGSLDVPAKKASKTLSAMDKFKTLDRKGTDDASTTKVTVDSVHQNAIVSVLPFTGEPGAVSKFCTSGIDGKVVLWDVAEAKTATGLDF